MCQVEKLVDVNFLGIYVLFFYGLIDVVDCWKYLVTTARKGGGCYQKILYQIIDYMV